MALAPSSGAVSQAGITVKNTFVECIDDCEDEELTARGRRAFRTAPDLEFLDSSSAQVCAAGGCGQDLSPRTKVAAAEATAAALHEAAEKASLHAAQLRAETNVSCADLGEHEQKTSGRTVAIKNTFIDIQDPSTPSARGRSGRNKTCPAGQDGMDDGYAHDGQTDDCRYIRHSKHVAFAPGLQPQPAEEEFAPTSRADRIRNFGTEDLREDLEAHGMASLASVSTSSTLNASIDSESPTSKSTSVRGSSVDSQRQDTSPDVVRARQSHPPPLSTRKGQSARDRRRQQFNTQDLREIMEQESQPAWPQAGVQQSPTAIAAPPYAVPPASMQKQPTGMPPLAAASWCGPQLQPGNTSAPRPQRDSPATPTTEPTLMYPANGCAAQASPGMQWPCGAMPMPVPYPGMMMPPPGMFMPPPPWMMMPPPPANGVAPQSPQVAAVPAMPDSPPSPMGHAQAVGVQQQPFFPCGGFPPTAGAPPAAPAASGFPANDPEADGSGPRASNKRPLRLWAHIYLHMQSPGFDLVPMLIGRGGQNMRKIAEATGAKVRVRGRGSGHLEIEGKREAPTPLMVAVTTEKKDAGGFRQAVEMTLAELRIVERRYRQHCDRQHQLVEGPCYSIGVLTDGAKDLLEGVLDGVHVGPNGYTFGASIAGTADRSPSRMA